MDLDQNSNYEWIGTFWFPDNEGDKFSGKVTYSPEQGIELDLMLSKEPELFYDFNTRFLAKKLMHALVSGERTSNHFTLVNIRLSCGYTIGNPTVVTWRGVAELLIAGHLLEKIEFNKFLVSYDDFFNNLFLGNTQRENDVLQFAESKSISLPSDCTIGMDLISARIPM